jgi:hypothetical protein
MSLADGKPRPSSLATRLAARSSRTIIVAAEQRLAAINGKRTARRYTAELLINAAVIYALRMHDDDLRILLEDGIDDYAAILKGGEFPPPALPIGTAGLIIASSSDNPSSEIKQPQGRTRTR